MNNLSIHIDRDVKCARCSDRASVRVRYAKLNLCDKHFIEYINDRVYNTIKRYKLPREWKRLVVGVSGGKDSLSLLYILSDLRERIGVSEIYAVHIDLGIEEFSASSLNAVEKACRETNTVLILVRLREIMGLGLPELVKTTKRPPCSICGLIKRYLVNLVGVELDADGVILGHHIDDILVFALKDVTTGDFQDLAKMTPFTPGLRGVLAPRVKLLYEIHEEDLALYSRIRGISFVEKPCPYKHHDLLKTKIREALDDIEDDIPGFKITLARRLSELAKQLSGLIEENIEPCKHCGAPSKTGVCGYCKLTSRIKGEPGGPRTRELIRGIIRSLR